MIGITSLQLQHQDETRLGGQPEDPSGPQSRSHLVTNENGSDSSIAQTSELDAFAEAVQALEQAKQVIAGRCEPLLALPVQASLDVVKVSSHSNSMFHLTELTAQAVQMNDQDEIELDGVMKALVLLDGRVDSAMLLLHELVRRVNPLIRSS